ncbi:Predicted arabinose efflux permease, MFS family [Tistlia consotensis]|uniref:Predicted arabinose efflux permease, MFS family n=1 Tax=Tistlia consotensis USBA 355 TaxID=560819 RepID=A0A1Y6CQ91_9PROT|nr:MFS transporter [Tistlia consotensis]SMF81260.1 Predicted arabinose efflux permease, MFS family [Tistlia consotensis USBA 355]SNS23138.1 Predicted arabinose efflux permease, MFS family [Tistlia consotensis]
MDQPVEKARDSAPSRPDGLEAQEHALIDDRIWRRVINALLATAVLVLLASALWVSQQAWQTLDRVLVPEFDRDAELVARTVASEIERADSLGIPFEQMRGMTPFLADYLKRHSAIVYIAVTGPDGSVAYSAGRHLDQLESAAKEGELAALDAPSKIVNLPSVRNASYPLLRGGKAFARLQVGMDRAYAERQIADIRWDVLIVLIVSLLITFELLIFVVDRNVLTPLRLIERTVREAAAGDWTVRPYSRARRDEIGRVMGALDALSHRIGRAYNRIDHGMAGLTRIPEPLALRLEALRRSVRLGFADETAGTIPSRVDARLPLFIFVFAEELSRSFLPLYAEKLYLPMHQLLPFLGGELLPEDVVVGLPIVVFMAFVALATPFGGTWVARYGARRVFLAGAVPAVIGYAGTAGAFTVYDLLVWRCLSAIGYAVVTIAAQGYLAATAEPGQRARSMAVFVGAITTAVICGSSIGAVLADRLGYRATFLVSTLLVLVAALVAASYMHEPRRGAGPARARLAEVVRALGNPRFAGLILLAAIPAKIALTGFLFYLTPLFLHSLDVSQPAIGRTIMLYGVFMLVGTQIGAWLGDRGGRYAMLVALGGLMTGGALIAVTSVDPRAGIAVAVGVFGLAQGIASAPMLALLPILCPEEARTYGETSLVSLLRLSERVGSVIGPLLAATLIATSGYNATIAVIGGLSAVTALLFYPLAMRIGPAKPDATRDSTA